MSVALATRGVISTITTSSGVTITVYYCIDLPDITVSKDISPDIIITKDLSPKLSI